MPGVPKMSRNTAESITLAAIPLPCRWHPLRMLLFEHLQRFSRGRRAEDAYHQDDHHPAGRDIGEYAEVSSGGKDRADEEWTGHIGESPGAIGQPHAEAPDVRRVE